MIKNLSFLKENLRLNVERLLYALVFILIFEGIIRKLLPSAVGLLIFFLKDIFSVVGLVLVAKSIVKETVQSSSIYHLRRYFLILLIPVLINTNFRDPKLALFGLKQYMLYMVIGMLVPLAFTPDRIERFKKFIFYITLTIIPTTFIAVMQNSLSADHWLNRSVDGSSLEAFSAGGLLRVSSTFSFTGQYSWFLNIACVILVISFCLPTTPDNVFKKRLKLFLIVFVCINFIIGAFITGGRTAVLGSGLVMLLGFLFAVIKAPQKIITRGLILIAVMGLSLTALRIAKPEFFKVYDLRSEDKKDETHTEEVEGRLIKDTFGWTVWVADQDLIPFLFGNGIGAMSNGADKISLYAQEVRLKGATTEGELETTAWEGGMYLVIIWFGMRIWVIIMCFKLWNKIQINNTAIAASFLLGYIIVVGLVGTLSRQPPISIWWWLAIGSLIAISNLDRYQSFNKKI